MEAKNCIHLKDGIGIDRNFLKMQKMMKRVENKFECLGKIFFYISIKSFYEVLCPKSWYYVYPLKKLILCFI